MALFVLNQTILTVPNKILSIQVLIQEISNPLSEVLLAIAVLQFLADLALTLFFNLFL